MHDIQRKLEEANRTEIFMINKESGIRSDAILRLSIVDAENLQNRSHTVTAKQGQLKSNTSEKEGTGPIWNEALCFDITNENAPLSIDLVDSWGNIVISEKLNLVEHKEYRVMGTDIWLPEDCREEQPRLRIRIQYNYSDIQRFEYLM